MAYYFKKYILIKSNYEIYNKELLIIIHYLKAYDTELKSISKGFDIITNHENINVVGHWVAQDIELRTLAWYSIFHFIFSTTISAIN